MENLAGQGLGWIPTAGNLITGACYLGCLALSSKLDQSLDAAIVVLAPILLLFNQVRPVERCPHILLLPNQVKRGELLACHAAAESGAHLLGRLHAGSGTELGLALLTPSCSAIGTWIPDCCFSP